jgi:hypothetical protein
MTFLKRHMGLILCAVPALASFAAPAWADVKDYEFRLVQQEAKAGDSAVIAVTLIDKRTNQPVPGAVIFAKRMDMAPDGMAAMTSPLTEMPSDKPGEYRFRTNLTMQGRWQLSLGAKVQGEAGSVQTRLILKAVP